MNFNNNYDTILTAVNTILTIGTCILDMTCSNLLTGSGICSINSRQVAMMSF